MEPNVQILRKVALLVLFLLTACGPHSLEDFREEGEKATRLLIKELQSIETREQLLQKSPVLQKLFYELTEQAIAAREFRDKYRDSEPLELSLKNHELSDQLRQELNRLFRLEGGREIIEKCQEKALYHLDIYEKKWSKKSEQVGNKRI